MVKEYREGEKFMRFAISNDERAKFVSKYDRETHRMEFSFEKDGKVVPMGFSYKFAVDEVNGLLDGAGFNIVGADTFIGKYNAWSGKPLNSGPEYMVVLAQKK